ncbi:MAG: HAD-IC family P-type ATPase [Clostridium sp.]|nr:MAG: HAD-IC family P-type ATPase [Clostridium sp.]
MFGRVTPKQKKQIIKALKENGKTVAMTGDGINDVLALKEADCSIAMASGTDGARNVSQLVLLNSDFSSIPHIVAEGRRTINNIERSASLLLVKKQSSQSFLVLLCIILGSKYFFIPIQLTLITTFTIGIPSFILALEPNTDIVKGNFLVKVIGKSVPAALTVVFNVIIVEMFKYAFNLPEDIVSSLVVFLTGISGFIFLYKLCEPFNAFRFTLWITLLAGFEYCAIFQSNFFNIKSN